MKMISTEKMLRPFLGDFPGNNLKLIERFVELGMVELRRELPRVINCVFAVTKDVTKKRLIVDVRSANMVFEDPPLVEIPNHRNVRDGEQLFIAKSDLDNYYHRLSMQEWM